MTITGEQAAKLHETLPGVQTDMMNGDCLAVLLCSYFDDGQPNPDSDNGWNERAEAGYEEVIAAIRAHYDPVIRALIASEAARKLAEERLAKVVEGLSALNRAAGEVARQGAVTGPQWTRLNVALLKSRAIKELAARDLRVRKLVWEYHEDRGTWTTTADCLVGYIVSDSQWACYPALAAWTWVDGGDEAAKAAAQADYADRILAALEIDNG